MFCESEIKPVASDGLPSLADISLDSFGEALLSALLSAFRK